MLTKKESFELIDKIKKIIIEKKISKKDVISNLILENLLFELKLDKEKLILKRAKKLFKKIEINFDEVYLLYFHLYQNEKFFFEKNNKFLIDVLYFFIEKFNYFEDIKYADKLNLLLGKLELGYKRYFSKKGKYKIEYFSDLSKEYKIKDNKEIYFYNILEEINNIKSVKKRKTEIKRYKELLKYFPEKVFDKNSKDILEIEKSLFLAKNLDLKKKGNFYIENQDNLYSIYTTYSLTKNFIKN